VFYREERGPHPNFGGGRKLEIEVEPEEPAATGRPTKQRLLF